MEGPGLGRNQSGQDDAAVDLSNVHFGHLAGEHIAHGGFETQRNAKIFGKMIQRAYRENTQRGISACHHAGQGVDGAITSTSHDQQTVLAQARAAKGLSLSPLPGHEDLRRCTPNSPEMRADVRPGRLHMNRSAIEDPGRPRGFFRRMRCHMVRLKQTSSAFCRHHNGLGGST